MKLRESVRALSLGPEVWTKTAFFPMPGWDGQVDHIHLVRVNHFVPRPRLTPEQLRAENVHEIRWWAWDELTASSAAFAPRALPALLRPLVSGAVPTDPVAITGF